MGDEKIEVQLFQVQPKGNEIHISVYLSYKSCNLIYTDKITGPLGDLDATKYIRDAINHHEGLRKTYDKNIEDRANFIDDLYDVYGKHNKQFPMDISIF